MDASTTARSATARGLGRAAVLAIALALTVTACSSGSSGSGDVAKNVVPTQDAEDNNPQPLENIKDGGELREPLQQWITQWNPYQVDGRYGDAVEAMGYLEAKLFHSDAKGVFHPTPEYLVSAEVTSQSPQVVTYKVNPKAKWSDGKQIGYQDFKAVWETSNGKNPAYNIADSSGYEQIASVEKGADDQEVKVTFAKPYADWQNLFNPLLPASGLTDPNTFNTGWIEKVPVFGGPFKIGALDKSAQTITLVPNPDWWGPKPKLDKITYRVLDAPAITQAFLNNEVDYAGAGSATAYGQLKDAKDGVIRTGTPWDEVHISFGGNGPLADQGVRQALGKAIDRSSLIKIANQGVPVTFKPLDNHLYMTNQSGYQNNSGDWAKFDPAAAKDLLTKAGWQDAGAGQPRTKDGQKLELHYVMSDGSTQAQSDIATAVQNMLGQIGVKLDVDKVASKEYFTKYVNLGKFDLASWRNTGSFPLSTGVANFRAPEGDNVFGNYSKLSTPEIDSLLKQAAGTLDPKAADKLYNQADAKIWELGHTLELYQRPSIVAVRKGLANFGAGSLADTDILKVGWQK
ncbi:Putative peptide ABC transporter substrate-binding protein [Kitasatospora sp. MMS16-BH015]|uniref:ABC transporter family substrate-binding protein n=1 Tax=Kitasatospora sp. MMS16-BH015 TaxID=2018025 RepID=UPI000CA1CAB9|nr:ABC transporter family substrate-binding protein [Kitasatospora sp. MMS16-BH015]AUG77363.1 Putative peptide ABC transporter substrate-binding protein [Kitasatospora sp. MMS16-BH015]